ncbi:hypothetical protein BDK51DRAFT_13762, partial [Blyttiomyces helicus]
PPPSPRPVLTQKELEAFPQTLYTNDPTDPARPCSICLECFRDRDLVRQLPCRHFFHVQCIDRWLVQRTSVCPLCRVTVKRE